MYTVIYIEHDINLPITACHSIFQYNAFLDLLDLELYYFWMYCIYGVIYINVCTHSLLVLCIFMYMYILPDVYVHVHVLFINIFVTVNYRLQIYKHRAHVKKTHNFVLHNFNLIITLPQHNIFFWWGKTWFWV